MFEVLGYTFDVGHVLVFVGGLLLGTLLGKIDVARRS